MTDTVPQLASHDESALEAAFGTLADEVRTEAAALTTPEAQEAFRLHWLGRKQGRLKLISEAWLKSAPAEARKPLGLRFNQLKSEIEAALEAPAQAAPTQAAGQGIDISLPGTVRPPGIPHPLLETMHAIVRVFENLGYSVNLGPQVETDFYNFEALNFPPNHPARDTQDTLQIAHQAPKPARDRLLMRTHTSPVQIRTMIADAPPLRIVIPGKVHRNDAADATHSPIFHQVEGLAVDTGITFSDLKGTLDHAMKALFGADVKTRFFPSFFPFTEPSADVQISCIFCNGQGCRSCKHSGWIELLGCGMVDPAVFAAVTAERTRLGLDPTPYDPTHGESAVRGFAFGMGVERIAMILHGVSDIGHFFSGDLRFLEQFA
jgi:phenylalanyl-tRNA synthetase alpha chain